ncbi:MarR family transcriptional regulator [Bacillus sp. FJAT-27225]|uniref:MarR family winged helix-turn-helix transcriptional regulator n=1 Tax=Bacillus sp. FJAT-27225 TaxID=1743144 RepID=UPI00080C2467|nr:MarR family transcriptional regulator [Bacillus sp. FJAT-27225]OCA84160.1 MarR family transcriptional regulator [Bacillus sp. FJAT-27225]
MVNREEFIRESIDFLHRYLMKSIQRHAEEHGLTAPQLKVIAEVLVNQSITIKQLTQNLRMTQSTVSDIVERLSAKGILLKTPNPADKRSVNISVSERILKGIKESSTKPVKRAVSDALSLLSPDEQDTVEQGMRLFVNAVKEKMETDGMVMTESFDILFFPSTQSKDR